MKIKRYAYFIAPGFSIVQARAAFIEQGAEMVVQVYDEMAIRRKKGWRKVYIEVGASVARKLTLYDYKGLLKKYIHYVLENEGISFIHDNRCSSVLDDDELVILSGIESEIEL